MAAIDRVVERAPGAIRNVLRRLRNEDVFLYSAALGFYALVSLAPLVIIAMWLTSLVAGDEAVRQLGERLARVAPPRLGIERLFEAMATTGARLGLVAAITGIWPATSYGAGLRRAFDALAGRREDLRGLRGRVVTLVVLSVSPLLVLAALVVSYLATDLLGRSGLLHVLGWVVAGLTAFVVTTGIVAVIYRLFAPDRLTWPAAVRGAGTAAAGIGVLSLAYLLYLSIGTDFERHYATGGLAAAVLLAVWLFLSNALVLVGYEVAAESDARR